MAVVYTRQQKFAAALPLSKEALQIRVSRLGAEHPDTVKVQQLVALLQQYSPFTHAGSARSAPQEQQHIQIGSRIRVQGLVSALQHNGCRGTVASFDNIKQRYGVLLDSRKELLLRPACVLQTPQVRLENGGEGVLVDVDEDAGLYTIELSDSTVSEHPRTAVKLPEGTWVRLDGLMQRSELNGVCGAIRSFDPATGRYAIHLSSSSTVRIKPENIRLNL